tara:strand:- start:4563 stop:5141 length:579 start_codon:yes stop_codon:yes gene_type:complete
VHNLQLSDYVKIYNDVANKALINSLLKMIYEKGKFKKAGTYDENGNVLYEDEIRNVEGFFFEEELIDSVAKRVVHNKLLELTSNIVEKYSAEIPFAGKSLQKVSFQFLNYSSENKGHYVWHTDANTKAPRFHTIILGLNSEYEGGELFVLNEKINIKLQVNQAIVFPSNFCFPHKVNPVLSGNRKVLVIWTE